MAQRLQALPRGVLLLPCRLHAAAAACTACQTMGGCNSLERSFALQRVLLTLHKASLALIQKAPSEGAGAQGQRDDTIMIMGEPAPSPTCTRLRQGIWRKLPGILMHRIHAPDAHDARGPAHVCVVRGGWPLHNTLGWQAGRGAVLGELIFT